MLPPHPTAARSRVGDVDQAAELLVSVGAEINPVDPESFEPSAETLAPTSMSFRLKEARRFDAFVRRYRRPLIQYFRRRAIQASDAEDLVQTVFLRLLQKLQSNDGALSDAYVFTAASSVLVDHHRRRGASAMGAAVELDTHLASAEPGAQQILEDRQSLRVMLGSLSKMGGKWRRAFVLHRFESMSYAEIARKMGVSASSVEKYVMAALAELRDSIDRDRHD